MQRLQVPVLCSAGFQLDLKTQDIFNHFYEQIAAESYVDIKKIRPLVLQLSQETPITGHQDFISGKFLSFFGTLSMTMIII